MGFGSHRMCHHSTHGCDSQSNTHLHTQSCGWVIPDHFLLLFGFLVVCSDPAPAPCRLGFISHNHHACRMYLRNFGILEARQRPHPRNIPTSFVCRRMIHIFSLQTHSTINRARKLHNRRTSNMDIWNAITSLFCHAHGSRFYICLCVPALVATVIHFTMGWTDTTLSICAFILLVFSVIGIAWQHFHEKSS